MNMLNFEKFICDLMKWSRGTQIYGALEYALYEQGYGVEGDKLASSVEKTLESFEPGDCVHITESDGTQWDIIFSHVLNGDVYSFFSFCSSTGNEYFDKEEDDSTIWGDTKDCSFRLCTKKEASVLKTKAYMKGINLDGGTLDAARTKMAIRMEERTDYNKLILEKLGEVFEKYPYLRFGQLIETLNHNADVDFFNEEPKKTYERLCEKYKNVEK